MSSAPRDPAPPPALITFVLLSRRPDRFPQQRERSLMLAGLLRGTGFAGTPLPPASLPRCSMLLITHALPAGLIVDQLIHLDDTNAVSVAPRG